MNNNSGGGSKKRPPSGRGDPSIRKSAASSKSNKQVQRPTPSPGNKTGKNREMSNTARNHSVGVGNGSKLRNNPQKLGNNSVSKNKKTDFSGKKTGQKEKSASGQIKNNLKSGKKFYPSNNRRTDSENMPMPRLITPAREPVNPYIKKMRRVLLGAVTLLILIAVCVGLSLTVFFKIDEITVEGKTRYDKEDIIVASKINKGDNLLLCDTLSGAKEIENKFSYIEEVEIKKKLFNKINITVTEAKPTTVVENNGKYLVLSKSGKIIEIIGKNKYKNIPEILGAKLKNVKLSSKIQYKDKSLQKYIDRLTENISKYKIPNIKTIDITDTTSIRLIKNNGFIIIIGTFENIEYKLKTASDILSNNVRENSVGTLDVSLASADGGKSYLKIGYDSSNVNSKPSDEKSKPQQSKVKEDKELSSEPEENSKETVDEETSVSDEGNNTEDNTGDDNAEDNTEDTYTGEDYTDDYTEDTYTGEDYTDDYTEDTYTGEDYTDDYTEDTYTGEDYTDDYTEDTYTGEDYTDDNTEDTYTGEDYTDDYTDDTYTGEDYTDDYTDDTYYE